MMGSYPVPNSVYFVGQQGWDVCEVDELDNIVFPNRSLFKVGITSQIDIRMKALRYILKDDIDLIWFSPAIYPELVERIVFHVLDKYRVRGEWLDFGQGNMRHEMVSRVLPEILHAACMLTRYNSSLGGCLSTRVSVIPPVSKRNLGALE